MANKRPEIQQIGDCVMQLAQRCAELNDNDTASILYCVSGAIDENSTNELSAITVQYSLARVLKALSAEQPNKQT